MKDRRHCRMLRHGYFLPYLLLFLVSWDTAAEIIPLEMGNDLVATAEYLPGEVNLTPILILHGFLQTRDFITVRRLADSLHENGHSVLLPNLTLGITMRQQSLSCEAIHTHSMEQDVSEVSRWIDWLSETTHRKIVMIGHSVGSLQVVAYLSHQSNPPVDHAFLISLIGFGMGPLALATPDERARAQQALLANSGSLGTYGLTYCKEYLTTPDKYLSYVVWDRPTTLSEINRISTPVTVILGGADQRLGTDWAETLKQANLHVIEIEEANHFFDFQHEFDLLESIEGVLGNLDD
ncbi:MAG: alpha/beta hydrolase family protein [Gammaproteobacteria bacterium]|nr:alpha/beta hydrolase family protein [Gammaproteobacteria bacterium]